MKKYILCCFVIFLSFCFTKIVFADIEISEIMYDVPNSIGADAGNEWLELYNNGSDPVTIKGGSSGTDSWRIYQESSTQTINNRTFATTSYQGGMTIDPGKYAVVTESGENFLKNYAFDGDIFVVSAMSLTNNTQEQGSQKIGLRLGSSGRKRRW